MKKTSQFVCKLKNNPYLCIAYHMKQASVSPTTAVGIFYAVAENDNSSVPCGTLMRPQPVSGGKQWVTELFSYPTTKFIVSFKCLPK